MEQQRRRNPAEQQLAELIKDNKPAQPPLADESLTPGKGSHSQPLPDGGHMIISDGFNHV